MSARVTRLPAKDWQLHRAKTLENLAVDIDEVLTRLAQLGYHDVVIALRDQRNTLLDEAFEFRTTAAR